MQILLIHIPEKYLYRTLTTNNMLNIRFNATKHKYGELTLYTNACILLHYQLSSAVHATILIYCDTNEITLD